MEVLGFSERVGGFLFDRSVAGVDSLDTPGFVILLLA